MFFDRKKLSRIRRVVDLVAPSPDALERGRVALARAMEAFPGREVSRVEAISGRAPFGLPRLRYGSLSLGVVSIFLTSSVALAQGAIPGEMLYPVKIASETVVRAAAPTAEARTQLDTRFTERRLREADALISTIVDDRKSEPEKRNALVAYQSVIDDVKAYHGGKEMDERAAARITAHQEALVSLEMQAPKEMQMIVRSALRSSVRTEDFLFTDVPARRLHVTKGVASKKVRIAQERIERSDEEDRDMEDNDENEYPGIFEADVRLAEADALLDMGEIDDAYAQAHAALRLAVESPGASSAVEGDFDSTLDR